MAFWQGASIFVIKTMPHITAYYNNS